MSKNLKLFTDDTSRQTYEQSQEYLEPYVGGVSSAQTSSYNTRNIGKYFIDYTRTEHRLSDFGINNKDIIEVEYLGIQQGQYILTNYVPYGNDIVVETSIKFINYPTTQNYAKWFAAREGNNPNSRSYRIIRNDTNAKILANCYNSDANNTNISLNPQANTIYNIKLQFGKLTVNGTTYNLSTNTAGVDNVATFILGDENLTRGVNEYFYYFKVQKAGITVMDLIPVRIGNVGYMYDKVSRALFGNSGTGDFVIGPDVV